MDFPIYQKVVDSCSQGNKMLAILIDPDKFSPENTNAFLQKIPKETTHILVGGSTATNGHTAETVAALKPETSLPIVLFPGNHTQITPTADAILFLSLVSGRNPEYLVGQQLKAVETLSTTNLEVLPTGYILIDGGTESSVARVSQTKPLPQDDVQTIVTTAMAAQFMGNKLIYLEAGSGAVTPVKEEIIQKVKEVLHIPLIVGGGIRSETQKRIAFEAGADMVVMGTAFEE
ncbi:geranylgeranylglyceryl/heptaprenylglyceryl phosphate synthase [Luteirhabdus pelagi]|uniref:geranylgeranylglyceryl/heptaprenylglyceryl phosphate synthase n=1 Tax=Luteirhabdus pelagi TaxID=2792783 RepID=UPI0019397AF8|nr:geranylgeranylglyceryl/heptaprenylglyceryl phosphate synthase [Luteirhabdus pelagi]